MPAREPAAQVTGALTPYARAVGPRLTTVVGGTAISRRAGVLRQGAEIVVAAPGRLGDLVTRGDRRPAAPA
ncbi:superfamily II DNA/RNA helicase [Streptomyces sp. SFB5A]|uniref:Superfamily II DNA/RNA helicase n=1 Tax=Streptomyces nymphaeiformis TaxID=2663842 RepID=A0A7W7XBM8_9ACTN|nr:superfamily II DNA/RNA helicase [Streptomyces nymphaeiformis]